MNSWNATATFSKRRRHCPIFRLQKPFSIGWKTEFISSEQQKRPLLSLRAFSFVLIYIFGICINFMLMLSETVIELVILIGWPIIMGVTPGGTGGIIGRIALPGALTWRATL